MSTNSHHIHAKDLYLKNKSISDIATFLGVSRTTIYSYKNADKSNGIDWDELKFLHATDSADAQRNEEDFVTLLIHQFESALDALNNSEAPKQIETLSKYINTYYKLKQQRENPKVNKADVAKQVLKKVGDIALKREAAEVIQFLSHNADEIVAAVIS